MTTWDPDLDPGWDPLIGFLDRPGKLPPPGDEAVNLPKRKVDKEKLANLFEVCRRGNIRETRAIVLHAPHLLPYTDQYGFTALHHAQLSRKPDFFNDLVELFNNPRTFVKKMVRYETADDLRRDYLSLHRELDADRPDGGLITVRQVSEGSLAEWRDVVEGDYLQGVFTEALQTKRLRKVMEELLSIARGDVVDFPDYNFPVTFDFRGPACREVLKECAVQAQNAYGLKTKRGPKASLLHSQRMARIVKQDPWQAKKHGARHLGFTPTLLVRERNEFYEAWGRKDRQRSVQPDGGSGAGTIQKSISLPALVRPVGAEHAEARSPVSMSSFKRAGLSPPSQRQTDAASPTHTKVEKLPEIAKVSLQSGIEMKLDTSLQHNLLL